jgi:predicted HAD superfamily Cof-like phosphohydrolase
MSPCNDKSWDAVELVRTWLHAADLPTPTHPSLHPDPSRRELSCLLIEEETAELRAAVEAGDLVEIADAVADLIWVTIEAALTFGIPVEPVFAEVNRSNHTKLTAQTIPRNEHGKIVKGPGYSAPDILPILRAHGYRPTSAAATTVPAPITSPDGGAA